MLSSTTAVYAHIFLDNKRYSMRQLAHCPRLGDELRLADDKYVKVVQVVWCLDEESPLGQRVNIGTELVE